MIKTDASRLMPPNMQGEKFENDQKCDLLAVTTFRFLPYSFLASGL